MQPAKPNPPRDDDHALQQEYRQMADKVRSGEYFEESRAMYDLMVHDPMAERYFYIIVTVVAVLSLLMAYSAREGLFPLNTAVPYHYQPIDIVEDLVQMKGLAAYKGEDANEGILRYAVNHYVKLREEYNVDDFERFAEGVRNQSAPEVVAEFAKATDPANPESPVALYQRHSYRTITVLSNRRLIDQEYGMEVVFEATVVGQGEIRKSRWKANIAFDFGGVTFDDKGKASPLRFTVTKYQVKRLQDS